MEAIKKGYMIIKNGLIYDLTVNIKKEVEEEILEILIEQERETDCFFKFLGGVTNLIDQDKQWKKFDEISEVIEIINYNCENKTIVLEVKGVAIIILLKITINKKENILSIKLIKYKTPEFTKEESELIIISKIPKLLKDIKKLEVTKTQLVCEINKNTGINFNLSDKPVEYVFNIYMKNSGSVEFILNCQLRQLSHITNWLNAEIEYENVDNAEKGSFTLYNCCFSASVKNLPSQSVNSPSNGLFYNSSSNQMPRVDQNFTSATYITHPPIESKHIENLFRGNYKIKLVFTQSHYEICLNMFYIKLFAKIRY